LGSTPALLPCCLRPQVSAALKHLASLNQLVWRAVVEQEAREGPREGQEQPAEGAEAAAGGLGRQQRLMRGASEPCIAWAAAARSSGAACWPAARGRCPLCSGARSSWAAGQLSPLPALLACKVQLDPRPARASPAALMRRCPARLQRPGRLPAAAWRRGERCPGAGGSEGPVPGQVRGAADQGDELLGVGMGMGMGVGVGVGVGMGCWLDGLPASLAWVLACRKP
jgi:hypothetical protein